MTLDEAVAWREDLRAQGRRLVVTNGCFDLLHRGHAQYLVQARALGDALLVAVNSDASTRLVKGPDRPVVGEDDRTYLVACLEATDAVVMFETAKPLDLFRRLRPDIYVKGGDYTEETIDREEHGVLQDLGVEFRFVSFVQNLSTTATIRRVKQNTSTT